MRLTNRYTVGERWSLPEGEFLFAQELAGAQILFKPVADSGSIIRSEAELNRLRDARQARRLREFRDRRGRIQCASDAGDLPPEGVSDRARSRQFYLKKWDEFPCGTGETTLRRFIERHSEEAARKGFTWLPSTSTLKRDIGSRGERGNRPLRVMQDMRGKVPRKRSFPIREEIFRRAIAWYYSKRERDLTDAHAWALRFTVHLNGIMQIRYRNVWVEVQPPKYETLRIRIHAARNMQTLTAKYGEKEARWELQGTERGLHADTILQCVLIDGNTLDDWCVLDDANGLPTGRPTLTLAIDIKSRAVPGVIITYEGESLYSIMACVQQVVIGKHDIIERIPQFRPLIEDLYGKPDTLIVDNAWRQTGVSFQDACEDAGINIEWAPVKNPEYKAIIERFFLTLKKILLDKLPGGVPFDPTFMRKLGLDPQKTAAITLSQLEEFIYEAIFDVYHFEEHSGTGRPPLLVWQRDLARGAREIIDDVGFLAAAFGAVARATLTREGIQFRSNRFHDPSITTQLLTDLSGATPFRNRRKRTGSATAHVKIKYNPADIRGIYVWNPKKKPRPGYVFLPNRDEEYASTPGLGFWHHDRVREFSKAENLAFRSDKERCLARDRLRAKMESKVPHLKFAAMRTMRRLLEPPLPLLAGDVVLIEEGTPSVSGLKRNDVIVSIASQERGDDGYPEKGPRRGGNRTRSASRGRGNKGKLEIEECITEGREQPQERDKVSPAASSPRTRALTVANPDRFMDDLVKRITAAQSDGGRSK